MARRELEAARAWGVPRSVLLGRVVAPGEPLFLPDDRLHALALLEYEAGQCPSCGHPRVESMAPDNEDRYDATPLQCHACKAIAIETRRLADADKSGHAHEGLSFTVKLRGA